MRIELNGDHMHGFKIERARSDLKSQVWFQTKIVRHEVQFSVLMWRNHIPNLNITFPSQGLVSSDKRSYRNLTFRNVSARQRSSFCNRARLNFQAFALRDMNIATREGCRVGQKMSYHFSF